MKIINEGGSPFELTCDSRVFTIPSGEYLIVNDMAEISCSGSFEIVADEEHLSPGYYIFRGQAFNEKGEYVGIYLDGSSDITITGCDFGKGE